MRLESKVYINVFIPFGPAQWKDKRGVSVLMDSYAIASHNLKHVIQDCGIIALLEDIKNQDPELSTLGSFQDAEDSLTSNEDGEPWSFTAKNGIEWSLTAEAKYQIIPEELWSRGEEGAKEFLSGG